jgi:molybdenum cofactor biosynthesis protein B
MPGIDETRAFQPVRIAVLTISDTRTLADDKSGATLVELLTRDGHILAGREIVRDDVQAIRDRVQAWARMGSAASADPAGGGSRSEASADQQSGVVERVDVVITTGGTGVTGRDVTPEALEPLFTKRVDGFGELFRMLSYESVGISTLQSRAVGGLVGRTYVFALPGSTGACRDGWEKILKHQLDSRYRPCNLVEMIPRLGE